MLIGFVSGLHHDSAEIYTDSGQENIVRNLSEAHPVSKTSHILFFFVNHHGFNGL